jgi:integrase
MRRPLPPDPRDQEDGMSKRNEGIEVRHERRCPAGEDGRRCGCSPSYRASVYDARTRRRLKRTFPTLAEARTWRSEAVVALRRGEATAALTLTLAEAWALWLVGARAGAVRNRSGDSYKPGAVRCYEQAMRLRVLPELGGVRLANLRRPAVQDFVDRLLLADHDPSTIRNTLIPLRAVVRRAITRGEITVNPTLGLELPAVRGRRDRVASREEAPALLAALDDDRALWATAMYAGLRMGELRALLWEDVDLARGVLHVRRSWDHVESPLLPKSRAGSRTVPVPQALRAPLTERRLASACTSGLVFGRGPDRPFNPSTVYDHARRRWRAAGLTAIGLHECRHTYASLMIAAGVNARALSVYMGHASVTFTFDRYGHLMPGNEAEAAQLLDGYLDDAVTG